MQQSHSLESRVLSISNLITLALTNGHYFTCPELSIQFNRMPTKLGFKSIASLADINTACSCAFGSCLLICIARIGLKCRIFMNLSNLRERMIRNLLPFSRNFMLFLYIFQDFEVIFMSIVGELSFSQPNLNIRREFITKHWIC